MSKLFFSVHRTALLAALTAAIEAVDRKAKIPILANVLLYPHEGQLMVRGTDLDLEIETSCDLLDEGTGEAVTLKADDLRDIVNRLPETAEIGFYPGHSAGQVRIQAGRSQFQIFSLPESDFPKIATEFDGAPLTLDMARLAEAIGKVIFAVETKDVGRAWVQGVYLHPSEGGAKLTVVGANGRALALVRLAMVEPREFEGVIIPLRLAGALRKLFADAKTTGVMTVDRNKIRICCDGVTVVSRLMEARFPDKYERVIPSADKKAVATVASVQAAVARVNLVSADPGKDGMRLTPEKGAIRIDVTSADGESATDYIPADYDGEPGFSIGLNGKILEDAMKSVPTQDVSIAFGAVTDNIVFRPLADVDELYIIAPMKAR